MNKSKRNLPRLGLNCERHINQLQYGTSRKVRPVYLLWWHPMSQGINIIESSNIQSMIFTIRGLQVMVDSDLAEMYEVETKYLTRAVSRNIQRFPEQFRLQLTQEELENLRCQISTSSSEFLRFQNGTLEKGRGKHRKYLPYVFTEQGVSMLSAVLRSETAIKVSIQIMDAFVGMRKFIANNAAVFQRLDNIEQKHNEQYPPIEIKTFKQSHDRFLILDNHEVYHVGASLKDLGKKMFAFSKFDKGALDILGKLGHE